MFSFVELFVARVAANSPTDVWYVNSSNPLTPMSDLDRIFFWQYQYHIKQTSDENKEKCQLGDQ